MPLSSGEAADFLVTVLRGLHAPQDEIRTLQAQNSELRATANNVQGQLCQAHAAATKVREEVEALMQQGSSGSTSNTVAQADVALQLATVAAQIQALTSERDAARATATEATAVVDRLKGQMTVAGIAVNALKTRRSTLALQVTALRGGRIRHHAEIQTLPTARDANRRRCSNCVNVLTVLKWLGEM